MEELSDEKLMLLTKNGNMAAFELIVKRWEKRIMQYILRQLRNLHDSEDTTQEVFISVFKASSQFNTKSIFKGWIYKIALNACINRVRRRRKTQQMQDEAVVEASPEDRLIQDEQSRAISAIISKLPEVQRSCIILHRFEGFSYSEISDILGISMASVKSNIHRAYEVLKDLLKSYQPQ